MKTQRKPILEALFNASESFADDNPTRPPEQHSPLPWSYSAIGGDNFIMSGESFGIGKVKIAEVLYDEAHERISLDEMDANKAYIVKACNEYPKLLALLRQYHEAMPTTETLELFGNG